MDEIIPGVPFLMPDTTIIVALIAFCGACVLATPGFLAWRTARGVASAAQRVEENSALAARNAAEAQRIAVAVAAAVESLALKVDGRLSQLLEQTKLASHAAGVADERENAGNGK
jgi:hypothetical protein